MGDAIRLTLWGSRDPYAWCCARKWRPERHLCLPW